jgi:CheY-like chemotaxis protein
MFATRDAFLARLGHDDRARRRGLEILHRERPDVVVTDLLMPGMATSSAAASRPTRTPARRSRRHYARATWASSTSGAVRAGADDVVE